jgi:DNA-binding NtrC family response regulator
MLLHTLIAVDSPVLRRRVRHVLRSVPAVAAPAVAGKDLWRALNHADPDVVLVERSRIPDPPETWVAGVRAIPERPEIVVLSGTEDEKDRTALLAAGCLAVLHEGLSDRELGEALSALVERRRGERIRLLRAGESSTLGDFISESPAMRQFLATVRRVVDSGSSLLVLGETGVGKERLARAVHTAGPRTSGPFLAVNCGALPEGLLESELFGHEQGAFTGADRARRGCFEMAHLGTLFLDEIAEMPLHLQTKLLRVLEDRRIIRLGGEKPVAVDVRLMAATNRDLDEEVRARRFRADLYYRLAVVTLTVPPLRDRREDVPILVRDYLDHFRVTLGRDVRSIRPDALAALVAYSWPGNVRELINVVERAVLLCPGQEIGRADLPRTLTGPRATPPPGPFAALPETWRTLKLREARREVTTVFEGAYLRDLLREAEGRVGEAARRAGINERTLYELMQRHGLRKEDFRPGRPPRRPAP